jgi:hypothetical protein
MPKTGATTLIIENCTNYGQWITLTFSKKIGGNRSKQTGPANLQRVREEGFAITGVWLPFRSFLFINYEKT